MDTFNTVFNRNYNNYLRQLDSVDFLACESILGITFNEEDKTAQVPFFKTLYQVSRSGVVDDRGRHPDYGICVILMKYLLMCPQWIPSEMDWITYRDFSDSGQTQDAGLSDYAAQAISKRYAGNLSRLEAAANAIGGTLPEAEYPYDFSAVFTALPRLPILFLFNDVDEQFPATASILYERRAEYFLDAECRVMVNWYLQVHLKRSELC
jgi:hypothetical protein